MTSANPATPLIRAEFRNSCTSVLQGLECLWRQRAVIDEKLADVLEKLGKVVSTLQPEIEQNKEYYLDGPLVRFLSAHISKAKAVIQEIKRTCSESSAVVNGLEYCKEHGLRHLEEIQDVLDALNDYYQHTVYSQDTQFISSQGAGVTPTSTNPTRSANSRVTFADDQSNPRTPQNTAARDTSLTSSRSCGSSGRSGLGSPTLDQLVEVWPAGSAGPTDDPSTPGAFEHISDMSRRDVHLDNWPKERQVPSNLMERTKPPLAHPGLRDLHNYNNLPQFAGINLPIKQVPVGELALPVPHVAHWDYHNNCRY